METKIKIDFLQIGFIRCATNFLLSNVYPHNPHLECVNPEGRYWELERLLRRDFILADGFEYDRQNFEREFKKICPTIFTNKQVMVKGILFRPFTFYNRRRFDRKNVIDRINESFPEVKIIMPIRSQRTWIQSFYSIWVAAGGLLGFHDFVESFFGNENLVAHYIDWFPLVSYLHKLFGSERVLIYVFEELKESPQGIANRIFDFLEVPRVQIDESPIGRSLSKEVLPLRRFLNHLVHFDSGSSDFCLNFRRDLGEAKPSKISALYNSLTLGIYHRYTGNLCRMIDNAFRFKGRLKLEERHLKMIEQRYSGNNRKLSQLLNVDLSNYGYP